MKLQLFEPLPIKFEQADWSRNPAFGLLDIILESYSELVKIVSGDILKDWQAWTKDVENVTYPATGKFLKLQNALIVFLCLFMTVSCQQKTKMDNESFKSTVIEPTNCDTIADNKNSYLNIDSLRFSELISLIEQLGLIPCDSLMPEKEDLLFVFLGNNNRDIISHFVEGYGLYFDDGYNKKPRMYLSFTTFDSEIYADRFAEAAFINEIKEDKSIRVTRFSNSIYRIVYLTDLLQSRVKYENLLAEWDKMYWDKMYPLSLPRER